MKYLKIFQKEQGLEDDGLIGKNTLLKMKEVFKINNNQLAHFLGQIDHETHGFYFGEENLNYSKAGLLKIFKYDFDINKNKVIDAEEELLAEKLARKPEQIANFVYANQNGNGDENSGDGWMYRGRGAIQLTGRDNYVAFAKSINDMDVIYNPQIVANKYYFQSALFFFNKHNLWKYCNEVTDENIKSLTKRINGGYNGLEDRIDKTYKYKELIDKYLK